MFLMPHANTPSYGRIASLGKSRRSLIRGTPKEPIGPLLFFRSDDEGRTWSDPVTLFEGPFYNPACAYVKRDGQFYWCCTTNLKDRELFHEVSGSGSVKLWQRHMLCL